MAEPVVRLYDALGQFVKRISATESARELASGNAENLYEERGGKPIFIGIGPAKPHNPSPCAITFEEMQANVGIGSRAAVQRAQEKIGAYYGPGIEPKLRAHSESYL